MQSFIDRTAEYIFQHYHEQFEDLSVVVPNRRSRLYLHKAIGNRLTSTVFLPEIDAIEDFFSKFSPYRQADQVQLVFELFDVHRKLKKQEGGSFEEFLAWAPTLLADFNDLDLYLVNHEDLFGYLSEVKAINNWNLGRTTLTEYQKKYIHFFRSFANYYIELNAKLHSKGIAYQGMLYRNVTENIGECMQGWKKKYVLFCGFNALNKCEESLIAFLEERGDAQTLWDADHYYVDDESQEAGTFIRQAMYKRTARPFHWVENGFKEPKQIDIVGVPLQVGQAKVLTQLLLESAANGRKDDETAIILCDEGLLMPLINSMPDEIARYNVTMGVSLKKTVLFQLFSDLVRLAHDGQRLAEVRRQKEPVYYYKNVLAILQAPIIKRLVGSAAIAAFTEKLATRNMSFLWHANLQELTGAGALRLQDILALACPHNVVDADLLLGNLQQLIVQIRKFLAEETSSPGSQLDLEYLFHFSMLITRLKEVVKQQEFTCSLKVVGSLFEQLCASASIPFRGEPLTGLQVMGVLETQTLGFKHVYMLSVNENIIPAGQSFNTFIPFDIRADFHLPTYRDRDAVYAYHFYRLIQGAEHAHLIYNTEADDFGKGEKSRFITQLMHELPARSPLSVIRSQLLESALENVPAGMYNLAVPKTSQVLQPLEALLAEGLSPSSIATYVNCPLQFYFRYVAKVRDVEIMREEIGSDVLGSVVHDAMHELYDALRGRPLRPADYVEMQMRASQLVDKYFQAYYASSDLQHGKNHLIVQVAKRFIQNFLMTEEALVSRDLQDGLERVVEHLEKEMELFMVFDDAGRKVRVKGRADRIDRVGGTPYIMDYKTGKVHAGDLNLQELAESVQLSGKSKALQLLIYATLYDAAEEQAGHTVAGILSFRNFSTHLLPVKLKRNQLEISGDILYKFKELLKQLVAEIACAELPFSQTADPDNCKYCSFVNLCGR